MGQRITLTTNPSLITSKQPDTYFWNSHSLLSSGHTCRVLSQREMQWKWKACWKKRYTLLKITLCRLHDYWHYISNAVEWLHTAGWRAMAAYKQREAKVTTHTSRLGARILSMKHLLEMSLQLKEEIRKNGVCSSSELSLFLLREDGIWPPGPIWPANGFFYIPWTDARRPLFQISPFLVSKCTPFGEREPQEKSLLSP